MTNSLGAAAAHAAHRLAPQAIDRLARELATGTSLSAARRLIPAAAFANVVDDLAAQAGAATPAEVGAALRGAAAAFDETRSRTTELVWTGPTTEHVPVRLTAQALRQVIDAAHDRLIVASFAVYRVDSVAEALVRAGDRGIRIDLIVESAVESAGRITFDGVGGLGEAALGRCHLYTWPADRRPVENDRRAALHAKFAVADAACLLVTSANLTGHALGLNMELGILVTGGEAPRGAVALVDDLIGQGDLVPFAVA